MNKNAIKKFAIEARKKLIASVSDKAGMLGITLEGCSEPITKGADFEVYKTVAGTEVTLNKNQCRQRRKLKEQIEARGFEAVIEEVAYTWFNRICAIRFMEVNDYLPTRVRVLSSEKEGKNEPDIVTQSPDVDLDFTDKEREYILDCKMNNKLDELFKMLFIKQCNKLSEILPELFEATEDYTEMLLNISYTNKDDIIYMLVNQETGIPEANFNVSTIGEDEQPTGQVEIIGWLYQYYNTELKDDTFAQLKKNVKISKERIPAATQLFTPDWIVRYMVENSVGRLWIEHLRAVDPVVNEKEVAERFGWKYYLPEAEQEADVNIKLAEIRSSYKDLKPEDITCIDPCMGSGHILVAMFDVLMEIYVSTGYSERDAAIKIIEKNIFGLDIDKRAYQLSYFALMMKGRGYNRRFFREIENGSLQPNVFVIQESNDINKAHLKYFGNILEKSVKDEAMQQIELLLTELKDAREFGSLTKVSNINYELLDGWINDLQYAEQMSFETIGIDTTCEKLRKLLTEAKVLSRTYKCVITNPPYMGNSSFNPSLVAYTQKNYPNSKLDLSTIFMEVSSRLTEQTGYYAMINIPAWMFLTSYEKLRNILLVSDTISSMAHLGRGVFGSDFGTTSFVIRKGYIKGYGGSYRRLFEKQVKVTSCDVLENKFLNENISIIGFQDRFSEIPGKPIAYWVSDAVINSFANNRNVGETAEIVSGMTTGNNDKYMRMWQEIDINKLALYESDIEQVDLRKTYWFPYNKGGPYRRWYGNNFFVVNWSKHHEFNRAKTTMTHVYLKKCLTWSDITFDIFSARACDVGFFFDVKGSCAFPNEQTYYPLLALLNSTVTMMYIKMLNPTVTTQVGDLKRIPFRSELLYQERIMEKAKENVELVKADWDSREFSWDFKRHYLISKDYSLQAMYENWIDICKERFELVKKNDTELNQMIAEVYEVSDIETAVSDDYVAIDVPSHRSAVTSLLSYAVGCILGRYSLDKDGVVYAGGDFNLDSYDSFKPDKDNIITITDEAYFEDDIVELLCKWLKEACGDANYEKNLEFIAYGLGYDGDSAKDTIRKYFINDFWRDHLSVYSAIGAGKRPIYWMFDSGKENGFKALVYLHRYEQDLVGRVRVDYLHKTQRAIEQALRSAEYVRDNASNGTEKSNATKKITKYTKQLAEIKQYDEAMAHIANQRINIDLDDGVKVNYEKFQGVEIAQEGKKALRIDLLAKI